MVIIIIFDAHKALMVFGIANVKRLESQIFGARKPH